MDGNGNKGKKAGGKSKKRKKSKSSPQAVSDNPNKWQCLNDLGISDIFSPVSLNNEYNGESNNIHGGAMASTGFGFPTYLPPFQMAATSPEHHQHPNSMQPHFTPTYASPTGPQHQSQHQSPNTVQQANGGQHCEQMVNMSQLQAVLCRMESKIGEMDSKLKTLDAINTQVNNVNAKLSKFDERVTSLETKLCETNSKLSDIEASRAFDSQICDEIKQKCCDIEKSVKSDLNKMQSLSKEFETIKCQNEQMREEMLDLQTRSMRDNVLIFGVEEGQSIEERREEDCVNVFRRFCQDKLGLDKPEDIRIDRAHRIGGYKGNSRPIVVKFNYYQDKVRVKQLAFTKLRDTNYRISDQYPREIQSRRKTLYPVMQRAKAEGKRAVMSYDKLYVDGKRIIADDILSRGTNMEC